MNDLTFLRVELLTAQKEGQRRVTVSTADLQSILHRLDRHEEHGEKVPHLFGYIISDDLRNMRRGTHMFAKVKRRNTGRFDCPIYYIDLPRPDLPPVPPDVYYSASEDTFFSEHDGEKLGMAFWQTWRKRKADFPKRRMTSAERETLKDLEDCMPDLDAPPPTQFSGLDVLTAPSEKT